MVVARCRTALQGLITGEEARQAKSDSRAVISQQ